MPTERPRSTRRQFNERLLGTATGLAIAANRLQLLPSWADSQLTTEATAVEAKQMTLALVQEVTMYYGGTENLGPRLTNAFQAESGKWRMAYQKMVFEYDLDMGAVPAKLGNEISQMGLDPILEAAYQIPPLVKPVQAVPDTGKGFMQSALRFGLTENQVKQLDGIRLLYPVGAVTAPAKDYVPFQSIRTENGVIKRSLTEGEEGNIEVYDLYNIGEIAAAVGRDIPSPKKIIPEGVLLPTPDLGSGGPVLVPDFTEFGNLTRDSVSLSGTSKYMLVTDWRGWRQIVFAAKNHQSEGKKVQIRIYDSVDDVPGGFEKPQSPNYFSNFLRIPEAGIGWQSKDPPGDVNGRDRWFGNVEYGKFKLETEGGILLWSMGFFPEVMDRVLNGPIMDPKLNFNDVYAPWRKEFLERNFNEVLANIIFYNSPSMAAWHLKGALPEELRPLFFSSDPILKLQVTA